MTRISKPLLTLSKQMIIPPFYYITFILLTTSLLLLPVINKTELFPFYQWNHFYRPGFTNGVARMAIYQISLDPNLAKRTFLQSPIDSTQDLANQIEHAIVVWFSSKNDLSELERIRKSFPMVFTMSALVRVRTIENPHVFEEVFTLEWNSSGTQFKTQTNKRMIY